MSRDSVGVGKLGFAQVHLVAVFERAEQFDAFDRAELQLRGSVSTRGTANAGEQIPKCVRARVSAAHIRRSLAKALLGGAS